MTVTEALWVQGIVLLLFAAVLASTAVETRRVLSRDVWGFWATVTLVLAVISMLAGTWLQVIA